MNVGITTNSACSYSLSTVVFTCTLLCECLNCDYLSHVHTELAKLQMKLYLLFF